MANLNRIVLIGRLTADPEVRSTVNDLAIAKFRLAVDRLGGLGSSFQSGADLIDIIAWSKLAEAVGAQLKKGNLTLVEGRIQNRSFEDQTGQKRWVTEVVARTIHSMEKGEKPVAAAAQSSAEEVVDEDLESDLPF